MKAILLSALVLLTCNGVFAIKTPDLSSEISNRISISLEGVETDQLENDFVMVDFKVENGEISVVGISGTRDVLTERLRKALKGMKVEGVYSSSSIYRIKIKFRQI